jgi:predicted PurR-regulated permease PerM
MAHGSASTPRGRLLTTFAGVALGVLIVTTLYFAQSIFIPIALAVFFTFLLAQIVGRLERFVGRTVAVVVTVLLATGVVGGVGWMIAGQVSGLLQTVSQPQYAANIKQKAQFVHQWLQGGVFDDLKHLAEEVTHNVRDGAERLHEEPELGQPLATATGTGAAAPAVQSVAVGPESSWLGGLFGSIGKAGEGLAQAALVAVLVVFMLLRREDLRNRVIRLIGHGRLTVTTMAIDDAASRVSGFLFAQLIVNAGYGLVFAVGLYFVGVPYALLWGFVAAVMRYVPYIGIWLAIVPPIVLSLAVAPGWSMPLWVIGLVAVLEVLSANVIEPVLFGQSIGVSEVALLVSAAFWAWLWGPIGLILSAPLTVCLVVLGKYVPQLEFFDVLLGDSPALPARLVFYQRLLARDQDEAAGLVEKFSQSEPPEQAFDEFLIPALAAAKRDREHLDLAEADEQYIITAVAETADELVASSVTPVPPDDVAPTGPRAIVLGVPGQDAADELALRLFGHLLDPARWELDVLRVNVLASELMDRVAESRPAVVCLASLPPAGLAHLRYLCKRLRARFPDLKIAVGAWGLEGDAGHYREVLDSAGADHVATKLLETKAQLTEWLPVFTAAEEDRPPAAKGVEKLVSAEA